MIRLDYQCGWDIQAVFKAWKGDYEYHYFETAYQAVRYHLFPKDYTNPVAAQGLMRKSPR